MLSALYQLNGYTAYQLRRINHVIFEPPSVLYSTCGLYVLTNMDNSWYLNWTLNTLL